MIPEAAVEAAAKASWEESNSDPWIGSDTDDLRREDRMIYMDDARVMLEAAAPHMLAEFEKRQKYDALDSTRELGSDNPNENPFRSKP